MTATLDDYLRDPQEIARRSFEIVRAETDLAGLPADVGEIALRVVHACGMTEIAPDLACGGALVGAGRAALQADRTRVASGKSVSVRVDTGGCRRHKKQTHPKDTIL